jgi:citrate synthase
MPAGDSRGELHTSISKVELNRIIVRGRDLTEDLVGNLTFTGMVGLLLRGQEPSPEEARMLDALLIVLAEHGLQPALPARITYYQAPESVQGAVAAALLGAGSKHLGTSEWCARMLQEARPDAANPAGIDAIAARIVEDYAARHAFVPGIGHRTHGEGDPRAVSLFRVARATGQHGAHCLLLERISERAGERFGRPLAINVTGAIGAIASDLGYRWEIAKAFALIGRTVGALAHIQEEIDNPLHPTVKSLIDLAVVYDADA